MITSELLDETVNLLSKLIQNRCVNPPGTELVNIKTIGEYLSTKGVEYQIFESAPNRGNLWAKLSGTSDAPSMMFGPSHVDVVPIAKPKAWTVDPFAGEIKDGFVWGRGAMDMLFIVATQTVAFAQLHQEKFQPKGDLILFIVADEEAGGTFGVNWMLEHHPDLLKVDFCVSEMGGAALDEGKVVFMLGEKGGAWKKITFTGTPGHGSMPYASDNAAVKAAKAILRIRKYGDSQIPLTTEYLTYLADGLGMGKLQKFMITTPLLLPMTLKLLNKKDPNTAKIVHSLSRMTMSPNMVSGGVKANVIPAETSIVVDIRTLPGQDDVYVMKHLQKALGDLALKARIEAISEEDGGIASSGNASVPQSNFVSAMQEAVNQEIPGSTLVPFLMPGVTDMRYFRDRGAQCYGFSLLDPKTSTKDMAGLPHGVDERIRIRTVELTLKVYYNLAQIFLK
ncbi:Succinyl-diaminopimelate desuccinylase [Candidatus Lokiarchaeum ossiferum]|uniref:Succinyl-diaminopimelate desuccinylase n=1 Tax=Candidatus Lokiarchaeum ossiferum TaxID=2951803 RepID=A0ABY6HUY4_9ARCH|nr:Succinyl-diaminopimelate desuccinylase [Candidatus Lokiarchaeum sp. B-35]